MNRLLKNSPLLVALVVAGVLAALAVPPAGAQTVTTGAISGSRSISSSGSSSRPRTGGWR